MFRLALILGFSLVCSACATDGAGTTAATPANGRGSYTLEPGMADYDSLKRATDLCKSRGGQLVPVKDADLQELSDYTCVIPKGK